MSASQPEFAESDIRQPALFIGHGSPLNAIEDNAFSRTWQAVGFALPRPQAILCISAHWETIGSQVTASPQPRTIHDFYSFPPELNAMRYPAPGSPALAQLIQQTVNLAPIQLDTRWGLDHGTCPFSWRSRSLMLFTLAWVCTLSNTWIVPSCSPWSLASFSMPSNIPCNVSHPCLLSVRSLKAVKVE